jgi:3-hydroxyacyl-CoA dehydrogenase
VPDVLGMHFFSPANVMKLLEIVRGKDTAPDVLATAMAVGRKINKVPVVVGVCHGFVGNRMLSARGIEAEKLLLEGALPQDVDGALTEFGFPMGPFAMGDLAGIDVGWRSRKERGVRNEIADSLAEQGRFGQKTGKGFYLYEGRSARPTRGREADRRCLGAARREAPQCLEGRDHRAADLSDGERRARASSRKGSRRAGRHRRGLALRLRLPGLARRPDALGRHGRPEEDPRPAARAREGNR